MQILRVIDSVNPEIGGPIEGIKQSGAILRDMGHNITVACTDAPTDPWIADFPFELHSLGPATGSLRYSNRLVPWFKSNVEEFDAVIVSGLWRYISFAAWHALRASERGYHVFPHGMLDPYFNTESRQKQLAKAAYWRLIEHRILRDAKSVLFTSDEERLAARRSFRPYTVNERVVGYGTSGLPNNHRRERNSFHAKHQNLSDKKIVLFLSRIHPKKGCDLAVQAFAAEAETDASMHLVLAGPDAVGARTELERLIKSLGIEGRVTWTGALYAEEKWDAYLAADVFLLPSHQENFGIVVAEALSCGLPVLISNKVNIWREVEASGAGFVEPDTLQGTRNLLTRWMSLDADSRLQMRANSRLTFEKYFTIETAAQSLLAAVSE